MVDGKVLSDWELVKVHHPTMFEDGVFAVHFHVKGKLFLDRYSKLYQVKARSKSEAVRIARKELKGDL